MKTVIVKRLFLLLSLLCVLLCGCGGQTEETPPWLYIYNGITRPWLKHFDGIIQEGQLTEVEYVFNHPDRSKPSTGMVVTWKLGDEKPVSTAIERPNGANTYYLVESLPLCLQFLEHLPEIPPTDCRISIWMPEEEELQELLAENDYLIGRIGAGEIRTPEPGEVPGSRLDDNGSILFGVLLVEDSNGEAVSIVLLEGTVS